LPILVSPAAICLLTFFFLSPSFGVAEPAGAKSARYWLMAGGLALIGVVATIAVSVKQQEDCGEKG
jgi:hypothetical protein